MRHAIGIGKHGFELHAFYLHSYYGRRRFEFTRSQPYEWSAACENAELFFHTRSRTYYLTLWFWQIGVEHWVRVPCRHAGVPQ